MMWIPLMSGIINAVFILDLLVTLSTGDGLAALLVDASHNSVAQAVVANIRTDPLVFWLLAGFILVFVCAIECLLIYIAFYSDISQCKQTVTRLKLRDAIIVFNNVSVKYRAV